MKLDIPPEEPAKTIAEFRSKCAVCGEWIEVDDVIVKDEDENWIHDECKE